MLRRFSLSLPVLLFLTSPAGAATGPNVIFILVDDQGTYDLTCYGATEIDTPRIDSLARDGVRFTDYYAAAPICSPSRAGLLTGCYPRRVGLATWVQRADSRIGLHPDELTLAELFREHGYVPDHLRDEHMQYSAFRWAEGYFLYHLGHVFAADSAAQGVHFGVAPAPDGEPTGRSMIVVTPDARYRREPENESWAARPLPPV